MKLITLLTDFGLKDGYAGVMKGVILDKEPSAGIIDITHDVPRQDVKSAMFLIYNTYKYFPRGSVHLVVVDPGVGSDRKIICVETDDYLFLAPDNGVLSWVISNEPGCRIYQITDPEAFLPEVSSTFHGRDIFAPVAARLVSGTSPSSIGIVYDQPKLEDFPEVTLTESGYFEVTVIYIDIYGNITTNLDNKFFDQIEYLTRSSGEALMISGGECYSAVPNSRGLFYKGSSGFIEIAVNQGSAAREFSISNREIILFKRKE